MSLNYKTCKALKDAGFEVDHFDSRGQFYDTEGVYVEYDPFDDTQTYEPTLSELIDAIGDRFESMHKGYTNWMAVALHENPVKRHSETGDTPEQAVANLYLALHK